MSILILPLLPLLFLAGVVSGFMLASQPMFPAPDPGGIVGTAWQVEMVADIVTGGEPRQTVDFAVDGQVTGEGGCNSYFGSYGAEGQRLVIGPLAATRMACPEPAMTAERHLLEALEAAHEWRRDGPALDILDSDGRVRVRLAILRGG